MKRQTIIILTILFSLTACSLKDKKTFLHPKTLEDGWKISEPDKAGVNRQKLEKLISNIENENPKLNSLVIARQEKFSKFWIF